MRNPNSLQRLKKLNTRQRKKQRVGEFTELGFHLVATFATGVDAAALDGLLDDWLSTVDTTGVSFGGHFDGAQRLEGVVFPIGAIKVDAEIKAQLSAWLQARPEVASLDAGELIDMWHYD
jgi:hypothetical protein